MLNYCKNTYKIYFHANSMLAVIVSKKDVASINISKVLLFEYKWEKKGDAYIHGNRLLYFIEDEHLYHDNVDKEIEELGYEIDAVIFASRHSSSQERKTLSVHPIGNFGKALYGGKSKQLVKTNPWLMRHALQLLKEKNKIGYSVSYEATHHGPWLEKPSFFIEVGSTSRQWNDMQACHVVAEAIMEMKEERKGKIAIGIGGGHYAPRFTDIALKHGIAFGHIAAKYAIEHLNEEMLKKMVEATHDCEAAYFHGKYEEIEGMARKIGLDVK